MISINKKQLNIGHLSTAYHTNFLLMNNEEFENDMKIEIKWYLFGSGPAIVDAFNKGELDLCYMGGPPGVIAIDKGVPIRCVAAGHAEGTIMVAKKRYKSDSQLGNNLREVFNQFKGASIGTPSKGSIHDVILNYYLVKFGLQDEIKVENYTQAEVIAYDMDRGRLEAGVGTPALKVFAKTAFDCHLVVHPDNFWENNPSYGIFFHTDIINNQPELVIKFLKHHKKASDTLRNSPKLAAKKITKQVKVVNEKYISDVIEISPKYCIALSDGYINSSMKFVKTLHGLNYISQDLKKEDIFDFRFVNEIHPEKDHF